MEEPSRTPISVILPVQQEAPPVLPPTSKKIPQWIAIPIVIALLGFALYAVASDQGWWIFAEPVPTPETTPTATTEPQVSVAASRECGSWNYDGLFPTLTGVTPTATDATAFECVFDAIYDECATTTSSFSGATGSGTYNIQLVGAECAMTLRSTAGNSVCFWDAQQLALAKSQFDAITDLKPEEKLSAFVFINGIGTQPGWTCTSEAPCPRCEPLP